MPKALPKVSRAAISSSGNSDNDDSINTSIETAVVASSSSATAVSDQEFELELAFALSLSLSQVQDGDGTTIDAASPWSSLSTSSSSSLNQEFPFPDLSSSLSVEMPSSSATSDTSCAICLSEMDGHIFIFNCCHIFCLECCQSHVKSKIDDGIVDILCPLCPQALSQWDLKQLATSDSFDKWLKYSLDKHLEENRHIYFNCPTPNCPSIVEKTLFDVVRCPICEKSACSKCYMDHEENVECDKFENWKNLNKEADKLFKERVDKGLLVKCGACNRYIEKNGGCNNMVCRCGHKFVWGGTPS